MSDPLTQAQLAERIETLLQGNDFGRAFWTTSAAAPITFTYKFESSPAADFPWTDVTGVSAWVEAEKALFRTAFAEYASFINVQFQEITSSADAEISLYTASNLGNPGTAGRGRWSYSGNAWDASAVFRTDLDLTLQSNYDLVIHELGHTFSLKHPGNYDVGGNNPPGPFLPAAEDHDKLTVMSYNTNPTSGLESRHLMLYDIAALQQFWGANLNYRTGNDTYTGPDDGRIQVLWDAGGTDTLQNLGAGAAVLDLRPGTFSSLGATDNLAIAYGATIENAIGAEGADLLIGNDVANTLRGNGGQGNRMNEPTRHR